MSAHTGYTPGPWHWDSDPVKGDPTGRIRYRVCCLGKTITQVYYSSFEGGPTRAEADARLIAAAPDLYESLYEVVQQISAMQTLGKTKADKAGWLTAARAALAKAGKQ
jgi:hypothetical protein